MSAGARAASFVVLPAIDIRGGRCVRLLQGDYARETAYADDPVEVARRWQAEGAEMLHVVDLDGALDGRPQNARLVAAICAGLDIPVEVSGGIRSLDEVRAAIGWGAARVQLGSAAVRDPGLVGAACEEFGQAIVVSVDARAGEVMTDGWTEGSGRRAVDFAREMAGLGARRLMFTDISRDGAMQGPNVGALRDMVAAAGVPVIASGGITTLEQLREVVATGAEGAIIGKALYEGRLTLADAMAAARDAHETVTWGRGAPAC
jgi:phosphoribosylformimino-5-aminoimidazole carboxamide ribotide isomerase